MNVLFFHLSIWRTNLWRLQRFKVRMFNCLIFQGNLSWENFQLWKIRMRIERLPTHFDPLSTNSTKWSNTLKQFVSNFSTNCLSVFDHFVKLALKGSKQPNNITYFLVFKLWSRIFISYILSFKNNTNINFPLPYFPVSKYKT